MPDWPAPPNVRAVHTTRCGGHSTGTHAGLNLGDHVGDVPAAVQANRAVLADTLGVRPVFLRQVHGRDLAVLAGTEPDGTVADACLSLGTGVACTIMVADCLPVLFTDRAGRAVAAAHAGWRGLAGQGGAGVLEHTVQALRRAVADGGDDLLAWLGPCIGPQAFEVGPEVKAAFETHDAAASAMFRPHGPGKWLADLAGLARARLRAAGVTRVHGNDGSTPWCTVANASRFFSHRRDRVSGRMAACIWRV